MANGNLILTPTGNPWLSPKNPGIYGKPITGLTCNLSLINGVALITNPSVNLALLAGLSVKITLTDAGKTLVGWIKGAGAGETYNELITNGDMELDASWSNYDSPPTNARSNEQAHGGTYSRKIITDAAGEGIYQAGESISIGQLFKYSAWGYAASNRFYFAPYGSALLFPSKTFTAAVWTQHSGYRMATDNTASGGVMMRSLEVVTTFYVDDVSIAIL